MELPEKVDKVADLRKYEKTETSPEIRYYRHKKSDQGLYVDGTQEEGKVMLYGVIMSEQSIEIAELDHQMTFSNIDKAIEVGKKATNRWDEQYEEPESGPTEGEKRQIEEDILDIIEKNDDGEGITSETIIAESDHTKAELEDGVNRLLNDGTIYEPRPNQFSKL